MHAAELDFMIAEQAATQQVLLMALRRIAALTKAQGLDPDAYAAHWKKMGRRSIDKIDFRTAPGHETAVRENAKKRLADIIDLGLR